jgi:hypothetical protein
VATGRLVHYLHLTFPDISVNKALQAEEPRQELVTKA